jgi:Fe-S cluster assembly ATPase SufC
VDLVKKAAIDTPLAVFPGVEITHLAGNDGVHLVVLFDMGTNAGDIDRFLTTVGAITGTGSDLRRGTATKGTLELLREVETFGAIAVLAHCLSTKGALGEMRGDLRTELVRDPAVLAVEAPAENYFDPGKARLRQRVYDRLDGSDPVYRRKLAVYQASDSPAPGGGHNLAGLGARFSYFWAEHPLRLESLRQCFVDRDARIEIPQPRAVPERAVPPGVPTVKRLQVAGGFLDGLDMRFHDGLTTILGAKGSGKSVAVELLRFALGQEPTQPDILKDHIAKLDMQLGVYSRVTVTARAKDGSVHSFEREYDPTMAHPYHNLGMPPEDVVSCHFFSQNEIVRLAESEEEQIRFIDSFFDFRGHQRGIDEVRHELGQLDHDVIRQIRALKSLRTLRLEGGAIAKDLAVKEAGLKSPVFARYRSAQTKAQAMDRLSEAGSGIADALARARLAVEAVPMPGQVESDLQADPQIRRARDNVFAIRNSALSALATGADEIARLRASLNTEQQSWRATFDAVADEYSRAVRKEGGDLPALSQARARLVVRAEQVATQIATAEQESSLLKPTYDRRKALLEDLRKKLDAYSEMRRQRCSWFAKASSHQIKASVSQGSNRADFRQRLTELKRGSYLSAADIDLIVDAVSPDALVSGVLNYDVSGDEKNLSSVSEKSRVPLSRLVALADTLLADRTEQDYGHLLELQYAFTPTDRPSISFRREDGSYAALAELSTGSKCTALLAMALCEGDQPIVVDQPEDSLDIRSIWVDMCERLRVSKRNRQFVFTTHNSSLAVASDSDKFIVLSAGAKHGHLVMSGAIDNTEVREEVIRLLEGGESTYFLKQRKYNVLDPFARRSSSEPSEVANTDASRQLP